MSTAEDLKSLQTRVWDGSIPLCIALWPQESRTYDDTDPYLIHVPRLSYLPFLLPKLHSFFTSSLIDPTVTPNRGWFSFEGVPLKWHYPIGLLFDLYSGTEPASPTQEDEATQKGAGPKNILPWKLTVHFTEWPTDQLIPLDSDFKTQHDVFMNSVKEADFLRNGSAKVIMSMSKDDSTRLWDSVCNHQRSQFEVINQKFLNPPGAVIRNVPLRVYLPTTSNDEDTPSDTPAQGVVKVVQHPVPPMLASKEVQTVGTALHTIIPSIFPSRRSPIHAHAVLHGAILPMNAPVQELMRSATYADGFLHIAVIMVN